MTKFVFKLIIAMSLAGLLSCEKKENHHFGTVNYIGYGTSFGECLGYCFQQMKVVPQVASLRQSGWDMHGSLPDVLCSLQLESYEFISIRDSIDLGEFFIMEETYGCPDCTDGGAEWVEISYDTTIHRVTFEFGNEPEELSAVIPMLRSIMAEFEGCND